MKNIFRTFYFSHQLLNVNRGFMWTYLKVCRKSRIWVLGKNNSVQMVMCCVICVMGLQWDWWSDEPSKGSLGRDNMARDSTMKRLSHRTPFISCVVFPPVTLKFPCSCFDSKTKKINKNHEAKIFIRFKKLENSNMVCHSNVYIFYLFIMWILQLGP